MEVEQSIESDVLIYFDNGENIRLSKTFLIKNSSYFEAMFCGKFLESQSGDQIHLRDISSCGFKSVIDGLKHNHIDFDSVEKLLLVLETSQLLQFTHIIQESIKLIKEKYLFSVHAIPTFSVAYRLSLQELYEKARIYILYNFKTFLVLNRDSFFDLTEGDLQLLLNDNGLNIDDETDVYDLVIDWCAKSNNYDIEYEMVVSCVHFNSMNLNQLQNCILKTNNLNLQNIIKQYLSYINEGKDSMSLLIRTIRNVPNVLCAIKNEEDGHAFIYRWDWATMKFIKFLRVDPLPLDTNGYHVVIKDMEIFVMAGEIGYGKGTWNETGWKYNLLTKEWKKLENFIPSKRRHGVGYFCGNDLFLIGGLTKHRLPNELVENFQLDRDKDTLVGVKNYLCNHFQSRIDRKMYTCLVYKNQLALISKEHKPHWFYFNPDISNPPYYKWENNFMNVEGTVVCAHTYLDDVYMLERDSWKIKCIMTYDKQYIITLHSFNPMNMIFREIKRFKAVYDQDSTICAINFNKAMVFANNKLEHYSIDNNIYQEYTTQLDSFHSNYFFSIPIY